ncbi:MAG TPA: hypothetical protein VI730_11945 [Burkholderiales bacterium]|nr:hypothetical protein [Burkholderiales bacterium]
MPFKIFASVVAMLLAIAYLAAPVIKLKDVALGIVALIGVAMMAMDIWDTLKSKDD